MNKQILYWTIGIIVVVIGLIYFLIYPFDKTTVVTDTIINTNTVPNSPKYATYIIEGKAVTLVNGVSIVPVASSSAMNVTTRYFGNEATQDLNGDGLFDIAFVLTQNSGGSGIFYYVVIALSTPNGYTGSNGVLLGDRIAPQTTEIKNGQVIVNYADRKAGEAMTAAPSVGISKYLKLNGNQLIEITNPNSATIIYKNTDYGFTFSLPINWQGHSIVKTTWKGTALANTAQTNVVASSGPKLLIRNPKWTARAAYEDIPILIFTISQWNSYLAENFSISAAPILASELARNNKYVFALPPRWNFDYSLGYKEAESIVAGSPLKAFDL